jgi:DNA-binding CsgD family transcriptional regulator
MEELMFISNLSEQISNEEYNHTALLFESLDAAARLTNASMFVIDFARNEMVYRTDNLLFVDEATKQDIQRGSSNPYWSLIREDDLSILLETRTAYFDFLKKIKPRQQLHHTFVIDYRICLHKRDYTICQKFTPLKILSNGEIWLGLFCITTSTHRTCEHIAIFSKDFRYTYNFEKKVFLPFLENMELTSMEKLILLRASKGLTTEQIADDLCRSTNTIKTHKSRLFDKLNVSSMAEAITFVQNYNLISLQE